MGAPERDPSRKRRGEPAPRENDAGLVNEMNPGREVTKPDRGGRVVHAHSEAGAGPGDHLRLAFVSHVLPFPATGGQSLRVRNLLGALRSRFHVTFLGVVDPRQRRQVERQLHEHVDDVVLLDTRWASPVKRALLAPAQLGYQVTTGLKASNFQIGRIEFSPGRLAQMISGRNFDVGVLQYWHAWRGAQVLRDRGIPVALDMHDILWRSLEAEKSSPTQGRRLEPRLSRLGSYRRREERAWAMFDAVIAINDAERDYVAERWPEGTIQTVAMGTDLRLWPYRWSADHTRRRVAFYAGLGGARGVRDALYVHDEVMPDVWAQRPETELVIIGANPPPRLRELASERVAITGYVSDPGVHLGSARALICPFVGRYGFRSRVIEAMASGVPVVCTPDTVYGMGLDEDDGLLLASGRSELVEQTLALLDDDHMAESASARGRATVEARFGLDATYGRAPTWLEHVARRGVASSADCRTDSR